LGLAACKIIDIPYREDYRSAAQPLKKGSSACIGLTLTVWVSKMSEPVQPPKDTSADTRTHKKGRVLEFLSSLPGLLTAIAATLTALGGLYVAFKPNAKSEPVDKHAMVVFVPTPTPSPIAIEIRLNRRERAWLNQHVEIELVSIQTLKGKEDPLSHHFNNSLDDNEHILLKILNEADVNNQTATTIRAMTQKEWESFFDSLQANQRETIEKTPFAKFNVYIDGKKNDVFRRNQFFEGEALHLADQKLEVVVLSISNTKRLERGSVDVRLIK
jgi:hypothetical protein